MSTDKNDISQIRKYLNGELDARAMHQLEREAQSDPFLMDALAGYETAGKNQQVNLDELKVRLSDRVAPKKERSIILWRVLPIAATLLITLTIGYLWLKPKPAAKQYVSNDLPVKTPPVITVPPVISQPQQVAQPVSPQRAITRRIKWSKLPVPQQPEMIASAQVAQSASPAGIAYKNDTSEYKASAYKVHTNATVDELLKKMEGFEVGSDGTVTHHGQQISKVRINGKDYKGGDVAQAVKNLPADITDKIQVIDGYGDQASVAKLPFSQDKVLNIKTDTSHKSQLAVAALQGSTPATLREVRIRGAGSVYKGAVAGAPDSVKLKQFGKLNQQQITMHTWAKSAILATDSTSELAEVVVPGYADKKTAQPLSGWRSYLNYIKQRAIMPDGSIGKVKLAFKIDTNGNVYGIRVIKGQTLVMNEKAIDIVKNAPAWVGEGRAKEIRLKIKFRKKA